MTSRAPGVRTILAVAALALVLVSGLAPSPAASPLGHLVLISIDGLRPEFYLDDVYVTRELRALMAAGSYARAAEPVFPSVTYPNHAAIVTGVRPARHGVLFNVIWSPTGGPRRWYEEAADLRAPALWEWARTAGRTTAAVAWPSTFGARIDWLLPERAYYRRPDPVESLRRAVTPGLLERLTLTPRRAMFKDVRQWDEFLATTAAGIIREARPNLLLVHLVQLDYFQHQQGREGAGVKPALARIDAHVGSIVRALREAGVIDRAAIIVTGDHGFQDVHQLVHVNEILARAGFGGCPSKTEHWRVTAHVAGGAAAVFVRDPADTDAVVRAEAALKNEARDRLTILTRAELDQWGAMTGAAFGLEAAPGYALSGACGKGLTGPGHGGTHGYLPSRASMKTGFITAGAGVRPGVILEQIRVIDIAPTAARLLGLAPPPVEGRVLEEILK